MIDIKSKYKLARFDEFLKRIERKIIVDDIGEYSCVGVKWYGLGAFIRAKLLGIDIARKQQWVIKKGDVVYNKLFAWKGSFAIADDSVHECIISDKFPTYSINTNIIDPKYLGYFFRTNFISQQAEYLSKGAAAISKLTLNPPQFWDLTITLPPLPEQHRIVGKIQKLSKHIEEAKKLKETNNKKIHSLLDAELRKIVRRAKEKKEWEFGPIPQYAEVNPSRKGKIDLSSDCPVSFVPMSAVDGITGVIKERYVKEYYRVSKGYTWFKEGDVIFARITPCMQNGKSAIAINLESGHGFGSTEFHVLRPGPKIISEWLHLLVRSKDFRHDASLLFKGTAGQQRVPASFLEQKTIAVPPIPEQKRLVDHLEKIAGQVQNLRTINDKLEIELNALLPSTLDKAFKGEL